MRLPFQIDNSHENRSLQSLERDKSVNQVFQETVTFDLFVPPLNLSEFSPYLEYNTYLGIGLI